MHLVPWPGILMDFLKCREQYRKTLYMNIIYQMPSNKFQQKVQTCISFRQLLGYCLPRAIGTPSSLRPIRASLIATRFRWPCEDPDRDRSSRSRSGDACWSLDHDASAEKRNATVSFPSRCRLQSELAKKKEPGGSGPLAFATSLGSPFLSTFWRFQKGCLGASELEEGCAEDW